MKVGDLVRYRLSGLLGGPGGTGWDSQRERVGLVLETHNRVVPTALVQWSGSEGKLPYRIDMLEVVSEGR